MKQFLPYNILLVLTVCVTMLMVWYNLSLREEFAVTVRYTYPEIEPPPAMEPDTLSLVHQPVYDPVYQYDDYMPEEQAVLVEFPLELNTATTAELMHVPQIGTVMAQRIVQYRDTLGGYTDLEQLLEISGIGEKTFDTIAPYLYLEGQWSADGEETGQAKAEE